MSEKQKKVYAVRKGRKSGLFYSWPVCQEQIKGYSGAEYKSFPTEEEAKKYLAGGAVIAQLPPIETSEPEPTLCSPMLMAVITWQPRSIQQGLSLCGKAKKRRLVKKLMIRALRACGM